jgi:acyl-CoA thioesterase YciA
MFPKDTNPSGNIFGGVILCHIDVAGAIAARLHSKHRMVTVCMKEVVFKRPVKVGDILTCWTDVVAKGRTSVTVKIRVEAERNGEVIPVTEGEAVYVSVDAQDRPIPLDSDPVVDDRADISPAPSSSTTTDTAATGVTATTPSAPAPTSTTSTPMTSDEAEKGKKKEKRGGKKKNKKEKKKDKKKEKKRSKRSDRQ